MRLRAFHAVLGALGARLGAAPGVVRLVPVLMVVPAVLVPVQVVAAGLPGGARASASSTVADMIWDELAECESGGDWRADTGNGYFGGLQIWPPTWEEAGGLRFANRPDRASRRQQTAVAEEILRIQGWEAWPVCAREIGMIDDRSSGVSAG
ncbi:transglycosylase family protein [Kitasatospora sp. NPDC052868]|uniref:transglycosylase family protein n=1 Tax=Kitasatospora sp. NPDC052868 TaxID=3364060 RepID=UPI0037CBC316